MRIGIDARFYGPESKGLGRYTQKLITYLEKIDTVNEYVIFLREENYDLYTPSNERFTKIMADYRWYSFGEQVLFPLLLYRQKCDLVHFPHFNVPLLYFDEYIVTIHDLILLRYPTKKASTRNFVLYWFKYAMYRVVIYCAISKSKKIIAVSRFTCEDICQKYPKARKKVKVIHEAAEIERGACTDHAIFFEHYGIMKPYMLYAGNAYPHKNLYNLVNAFFRYYSRGGAVRQLVLVGKDDYFYKKLEEYVTAEKIQHVTILHTIDDVQLRTLYEHATLFVFPSLYEGFGLPPLEAQLMKVPVLSHDHPCMREVLSSAGAYYCDASNVDLLALAMERLIADVEMRSALIVAGFDNARRYSWRTMALRTHELYIQKKSHGHNRHKKTT